MDRQYIAIDLKSFYASVECVERELDPLTTNLVVADASRTEKTICLAVSPSLKSFGIPEKHPGRSLFQHISQVCRKSPALSKHHTIQTFRIFCRFQYRNMPFLTDPA